MEQDNILKCNHKELFNNKILHQYDEDGQKGFLGYLLRYEQWKIVDNTIIFSDIKTQSEIVNLLKKYEYDEKIQNTKIRQQTIKIVKYFGVEFCEEQEENRLASLEDKKKAIEKREKNSFYR